MSVAWTDEDKRAMLWEWYPHNLAKGACPTSFFTPLADDWDVLALSVTSRNTMLSLWVLVQWPGCCGDDDDVEWSGRSRSATLCGSRWHCETRRARSLSHWPSQRCERRQARTIESRQLHCRRWDEQCARLLSSCAMSAPSSSCPVESSLASHILLGHRRRRSSRLIECPSLSFSIMTEYSCIGWISVVLLVLVYLENIYFVTPTWPQNWLATGAEPVCTATGRDWFTSVQCMVAENWLIEKPVQLLVA